MLLWIKTKYKIIFKEEQIMENEIMNVEEVMEDVALTNEGCGLGKAALIGVGVVAVGFAAYKVGKKVIAKIKNRKNEVEVVVEPDSIDEEKDKND
jgi:hypothetical protein